MHTTVEFRKSCKENATVAAVARSIEGRLGEIVAGLSGIGRTTEQADGIDDDRIRAFEFHIHPGDDGRDAVGANHIGGTSAPAAVKIAGRCDTGFEGTQRRGAQRPDRIHVIGRTQLETGQVLASRTARIECAATWAADQFQYMFCLCVAA